jgi:S-DNA-T family DNA segregation ATPase FtsK/SpoIIIE
VSGKGRFQSLDLHNVKTLYPAYGRDRGSFVSIYKKEQDISLSWPASVAKARDLGWVSEPSAVKLLTLFQAFRKSYSEAVSRFASEGLASKGLAKQAEDFGLLIETLCKDAKGDRNRVSLLQPLLELGTVAVEGGRVTAIVTPWHPLRLAAMAAKASQIAALVRHLLTADEVYFGDPPLFFKELQQELSHAYYPELVLGWNATKRVVVPTTSTSTTAFTSLPSSIMTATMTPMKALPRHPR